jgi:hypothetical protein
MNIKKFWKKYNYIFLLVLILIIFIYFIFFHKEEENIKSNTHADLALLYLLNKHKGEYKKKSPPKESKGELECKQVLESTFGKKFIKIRPKFLMNTETGKPLELDLYNPELKIAVEYSGEQHYRYIPYFHKTYNHFIKQQERDELKRELCKKNDICLIEVPYNVENIKNFLINELKKNNKI